MQQASPQAFMFPFAVPDMPEGRDGDEESPWTPPPWLEKQMPGIGALLILAGFWSESFFVAFPVVAAGMLMLIAGLAAIFGK